MDDTLLDPLLPLLQRFRADGDEAAFDVMSWKPTCWRPPLSGPKSPDGQPSSRFSPHRGPSSPDGRPSSGFSPDGGLNSPDGCLSPRFGPEATSTSEPPASTAGV
jgi:hypothetical protein